MPMHGVLQVVLRIDQCVGLESPHEKRARHHRQRHHVVRLVQQCHVPIDAQHLDVAISLTLDDWSNHNLKGFYVIIAHWVDVVSLTDKGIFMAILDVKCETSVSKRVGAALFEYLKRLGRDVMTRLLNVVSDNGLDVTTIVARLFQLVNTFIGYEHMREVNHVRCADHSVQLVVLNVLTFIKEPTEQLWDALITIPCGRSESPVADHKSTLDLVPMSVTHS
ncbi:unnamed protein product [Sphagnum troendelagicum]|uniref:Transposase n=1 Tax=Sphagnum troendelagicum TaxID=128251 RepID=A0ABP0TVD7_9BRYO